MTAFVAVLASVASILAGHPVTVTCAPLAADRGGQFDAPAAITLTPATCAWVRYYRQGVITPSTVGGVLTFTHEAMHAQMRADWLDETAIECRAFAEVGYAAYLLGVTRGSLLVRTLRCAVVAHADVRTHPAYATRPCGFDA